MKLRLLLLAVCFTSMALLLLLAAALAAIASISDTILSDIVLPSAKSSRCKCISSLLRMKT